MPFTTHLLSSLSRTACRNGACIAYRLGITVRATLDEEPNGSTIEDLIFLVEQQRDLIAAVATGKPINDDLDALYKNRRRKIRQRLTALGLKNPFRWPDLLTWWAFCSAPRMNTYAERRLYVADLTEPLLLELEDRNKPITDWGPSKEGASWQELEARLEGLKVEFDRAKSLDEYQDTGRRAREILIDAANLAYDELILPSEAEQPKKGDATGLVEVILKEQLSGKSRERLRQLVRAAWNVANKVTHSRGSERIDAFAAAQATVLVVRTLQAMTEPPT